MTRGWQVEHACPQCGAPVVLDETDHLMPCRYCRVCCYMVSRDAHRYYIPPSAEMLKSGEDRLFFIPYWRFKGILYSCIPFTIKSHVLDASIVSADEAWLPFSLGLRPQVLKLKFLQAGVPGLFPEPADDFDQAMNRIMDRLEPAVGRGDEGAVFYRKFLGDAYSLIYAPFFHKDDGTVTDGVTGRVLGRWSDDRRPGVPAEKVPWEVKFIPAVCPHCGWDLKGDKSAQVMICGNCGRASAATPAGLKRVNYFSTQGGPADVYLPFWRIKADTTGVELNSFGDYIRVANLPRAVTREALEQDFYFWAPAFTGAPRLYLRCCRNVTGRQPEIGEMDPAIKNLAPVNHAFRDAARGLKMALAHMAIGKRKLYPELPGIKVEAVDHDLVYIPFRELGRELVNEQVQLSISPQVVGWKRQ